MKRFKPILIGTSVVLGVLVLATTVFASPLQATGCFSDTNGHWAETFICFAEEYGIVGGYPDGTFRPENRVTRAEAAVMFQNTLSTIRGEGRQWSIMLADSVAIDSSKQYGAVTVVAPSDGALLINAVMDIDSCGPLILADCTETRVITYITVDGTDYNSRYYPMELSNSASRPNEESQADVVNVAYVPVSAGTHTISHKLFNTADSAGLAYVWDGAITVLYVPFDGTGAVASGPVDTGAVEYRPMGPGDMAIPDDQD